jgi:glyoxylase-like metal-dependent hydrolase (beta-lactamase superfamily II)
MEIIRLESYNVPLDRPANYYLVKNSKYNIFIDSGASENDLVKYIDQVNYILITHGHWDHVYGITGIKNKNVCMNPDTYKQLIQGNFKYSAMRIAEVFGYDEKSTKINNQIKLIVNKTINYYDNVINALESNEYIPIDDCEPVKQNIVKYIKCPGHSDDHVCYFISDHFFPGDNILPGGGLTLLDFLKYQESMIKVLTLNDWNYIHPGHGPDIARIEVQQWLTDIIAGKEKKMLQLSSLINRDWVSIDELLPKLYPDVYGPRLYIAARSILGYLNSLESMKIIEVDKNNKPWRIRKII